MSVPQGRIDSSFFGNGRPYFFKPRRQPLRLRADAGVETAAGLFDQLADGISDIRETFFTKPDVQGRTPFQFRQAGLPGRLRSKLPGTVAQLLHQLCGQALPFPVGQGDFIDHVITWLALALQNLQEIQPALAVGTLKVGK